MVRTKNMIGPGPSYNICFSLNERMNAQHETRGEIGKVEFSNGCRMRIFSGSVLDFEGDAMVNAANTGGVTGFGLDEMVNRSAGDVEIKEARRNLGGIPTGEAKCTPSFKHDKVKFIIHAVGPVYRENAINKCGTVDEKDELLAAAYRNAVNRAVENGAATLGFCILSAGVFRGERSLLDLVSIALRTLAKEARSPLTDISVFAFTDDEQAAAKMALEQLRASIGS
jgi:O-acetyl-ADP-ribose deacetylase (regulator of RNase III)